MTQLELGIAAFVPRPLPDPEWFLPDGSPRRRLWCSDTVRQAHTRGELVVCPRRPNPEPCCLEVAR